MLRSVNMLILNEYDDDDDCTPHATPHYFYTNDILWDRNECVKFWGQKVTVQVHGGITYAGTVTVQAEAYSTRRLVSS